jgi:hypothetical protein
VTLSLFTCSGWADTLRAVFPLTSDVDGRSPFTVATPCRMIEPKRLILVLFSAVQALRGARTCTTSKARHIMCQSATQRNTSASARGHLPEYLLPGPSPSPGHRTLEFGVFGTPSASLHWALGALPNGQKHTEHVFTTPIIITFSLCVASTYLEVWDSCSLPPKTHRAGPMMAQGPCGCVQCDGRCPNMQGLSAGYGRRCTGCSRNCTARFGSRLDRFRNHEARAQLGKRAQVSSW